MTGELLLGGVKIFGDTGECYCFRIPGNVQKDSEEYCTIFKGISEKISGNIREDSRECSKRYRGIFNEIPGNVQEDSGGSRILQRIFEKIPTNHFKFKLIKDTVLLKIRQVLSQDSLRDLSLLPISNETIEKSNHMII